MQVIEDDDRDREAAAVSRSHEQTLAEAFVELSDTLVADFDVVEFLHLLARRCVELLGVPAAGIMVADQRGALRVMASSSEQAHLLELFEVESDEGPCVDCYTAGAPVADPDLDTPDPRWQRFAHRARQAGFRSVHAVPVRLRDEVIGVLNLFAANPGQLDDAAMRAARGLANITTIGLLQHRAVEYRQVLAEQLQHAMNSRVLIEQAKGVLAEHLGLEMAAAFDELRRYAARVGRRLSDVAAAVAAGDYEPVTSDRRGQLRVLLIRRFDMRGLVRLRNATRAVTARHGVSDQRIHDFVLAVHEGAANAVRHGGGTGQLLLWLQAGNLYAEISDHGLGIPDGQGTTPTEPAAGLYDGRGLWLIRQICTSLDIDTGNTGTRLMLRYPLDGSGTSGPDPSGG
jgi:anti-sigma regulatory factor (Ser/Thr protein kinase)/GAF domain-containing protein